MFLLKPGVGYIGIIYLFVQRSIVENECSLELLGGHQEKSLGPVGYPHATSNRNDHRHTADIVEDAGSCEDCHPDHPCLNSPIYAIGHMDIQEDEIKIGIIDYNKNEYILLGRRYETLLKG